MPQYELTLIMRTVAKPNLVQAMKKSVKTLLDRGVVITKLKSLGHRDLPFTMTKITKQREYTANYFLLNCYMPRETVLEVSDDFSRDMFILRNHFTKTKEDSEEHECTLPEELQPPAFRRSVQQLRSGQKMERFSKLRAWRASRRAWEFIPKSFTIAPHKS